MYYVFPVTIICICKIHILLVRQNISVLGFVVIMRKKVFVFLIEKDIEMYSIIYVSYSLVNGISGILLSLSGFRKHR